MAISDQLDVWLDDPSFGALQKIGVLSRGDRGSIRFAYVPAWLERTRAFPLDPALDLASGDFFPVIPILVCSWIHVLTDGGRLC